MADIPDANPPTDDVDAADDLLPPGEGDDETGGGGLLTVVPATPLGYLAGQLAALAGSVAKITPAVRLPARPGVGARDLTGGSARTFNSMTGRRPS